MSAEQDNEWWQVDLGAAKTIDTVELNWSQDYGKTYKIQVSSDGTSFADVASVRISAAGVSGLPSRPSRRATWVSWA